MNFFFVGVLAKVGSGSISQKYGSEDPNPYQNVTDPENTAIQKKSQSETITLTTTHLRSRNTSRWCPRWGRYFSGRHRKRADRRRRRWQRKKGAPADQEAAGRRRHRRRRHQSRRPQAAWECRPAGWCWCRTSATSSGCSSRTKLRVKSIERQRKCQEHRMQCSRLWILLWIRIRQSESMIRIRKTIS